MKQTIFYLLILVLAVIIGLFIAHVPAFILLQVASTSFAMPLWLLFVIVMLLTFLFVMIRKIIRHALILPKKLRNNLEVLQQRRSLRKKIKQIEGSIKRARTVAS
jgi:uncharacterized protein HemY